ncbi:Mpo1-like protein [Shewanella chilikensis]|uniref:Mpo1-like protein n=1 Tax=Shewanella chilikensis TaxID=558541 RepID=UPI00399A2859
MEQKYKSFAEFYPFYLSQHSDPVCRGLHYLGSILVLLLLLFSLLSGQFVWLLALPVVGYGFAWMGHFGFEHNKPATFQYPVYSLMADWVMLAQFVSGKHRF